jgi:hypothetical protein
MDISMISAGLSSVQTGISILKGIREADGALEKAELKLRLSDLAISLADAKVALSAATLHIAEIDAQLRNQSDLASTSTKAIDGLYVVLNNSDKAVDGPFCARCWDVDTRKVRTAPDRQGERGMGFCPQCKNTYPLWNAEAMLNA